jgi:hypothetical protein
MQSLGRATEDAGGAVRKQASVLVTVRPLKPVIDEIVCASGALRIGRPQYLEAR